MLSLSEPRLADLLSPSKLFASLSDCFNLTLVPRPPCVGCNSAAIFSFTKMLHFRRTLCSNTETDKLFSMPGKYLVCPIVEFVQYAACFSAYSDTQDTSHVSQCVFQIYTVDICRVSILVLHIYWIENTLKIHCMCPNAQFTVQFDCSMAKKGHISSVNLPMSECFWAVKLFFFSGKNKIIQKNSEIGSMCWTHIKIKMCLVILTGEKGI